MMAAHGEEQQRSLRLGAALFNGDHSRLGDEVARLEAAGLDFIHLDVFDGHFVSDLGFPPRTLAALRPLTQLPFEVHLGSQDPLRFVEPLVEAGTDLLIFHIESVAMVYETLFVVRQHQVRVGLALAMGTSLEQLAPVIERVDAVLLLSRVTGEGTKGASFDTGVLPRIRAVRQMIDAARVDVDLQVAGGVQREHVPSLIAAGATTLALGGGLYRVADMVAEVRALRQVAANAIFTEGRR
jgi:ribulose-phosphate 3-epimerase